MVSMTRFRLHSLWYCPAVVTSTMRVYIILLSLSVPALTAHRSEDESKVNTITETPGATGKTEEHINATQQNDSESAVKEKLINLLMSSKNEIARRMRKVNSIHDVYKVDKMYKTGYLVSFANKLYQRLTKMYAFIEKQKYTWNTLQILKYYEEVTTSIDDLRGVLKILNMMVTSNLQMLETMETRLRKNVKKVKNGKFHSYPLPTPATEKKYDTPEISWSYYDESLLK